MVVLASAGGNTVGDCPVGVDVAGSGSGDDPPVQQDGDGVAGPSVGGGRPRRITTADEDFTVAAATARPEALGLAFTRRSLRNLAGYLGDNDDGPVSISPRAAAPDPAPP